MTNQSREAFEKWFHGFGWNGWSEELKDWMWQAWQAALSEGRRQGEQDAMKDMQMLIEKRARQLMLEHYDADVYKRALEEHLQLCTRPAQPQWIVTREQAKELAQLISDEFLLGSDCVQDLAALIHDHAADAPKGDQNAR